MENNTVIAEKKEIKKTPSMIENFGKMSLQIGYKLKKAASELFMRKPLSAEEKELLAIRK